jgi:hypothetical protein
MSLEGKTIKDTYKSLIRVDDNVNGVDSTATTCTDGAGNDTAIKLGTNNIVVQPSASDSTTALQVKSNTGDQRFVVDTSNGVVKGGQNDYYMNTQIAEFSCLGLNPSGTGYHDLIPFGHNTGFGADIVEANLGNGAGPSTTLTGSNAMLPYYWYVPCEIVIDQVDFLVGCASGTPTVNFHMLEGSLTKDNSTSSGDATLTELYDTSTTTLATGQINYLSGSQASSAADNVVPAGSVIVCTIETSADVLLTTKVIIKYHLR